MQFGSHIDETRQHSDVLQLAHRWCGVQTCASHWDAEYEENSQ